ncbi:hypothetical protein TESG_06330 [Trichophyton tonsurans CBS 112818]|uniref:Uncharacterized protein n=1 Tax=Trichophyton tonsurans (strain CBS 112818) TaxID=647933 RepID=F2S5W8_TRIT1|nr:hypothetical protein TESG_06330 [Trichophyton tonsurans CBS 112818]
MAEVIRTSHIAPLRFSRTQNPTEFAGDLVHNVFKPISCESNILLYRAKAKARTERLRYQGSKLVFVLTYSAHAKCPFFPLAWGEQTMFCKIRISLGPYEEVIGSGSGVAARLDLNFHDGGF